MSVINILDPHVADLIAAGEVVERPASAVKELVENSFDAGAKNVTVEIRNGGADYMRVTDDGCGMAPEDAGIAFLRHATSKLKDERGLEAIGTMGFRGEALAALSSVSEISLTTRRACDPEGTLVTLTAGDINDMNSAGCPAGTDIIVRKLFFNTPARQKFLKSDRSEGSACQLAAVRCALSRPDISLRFIRDGEEQFRSPGNGDISACAYSVLGRDVSLGLLRCSGSSDGLSLSGLISSPSACRGNRGAQFFFCNGRFIKSTVMQTALEQAYRNSLLTGRYPACVLYLEIPLGSVDVNVHPAKTEVKFSDEKKIFDLVYYSVLSALEAEKQQLTASAAPAAPASKDSFYKNMTAGEFRESLNPAGQKKAEGPRAQGFLSVDSRDEAYQTRMDFSRTRPTFSAPAVKPGSVPASAPAVQSVAPQAVEPKAAAAVVPDVENSVQNVDNLPLPEHKIVGELFKKYIVVELGEQALLIDKHAAHERMIFDRLKARSGMGMSQTLLVPAPLHLNGEDCEILAGNLPVLEELGFEIDALDDGNYVVRAVPADMYAEDVGPAIEEICGKFRSGIIPDPASSRDEILHTVACKAAIKAGWDTSRLELERVAAEVLSGRVLYCPHGRPVSFIVSMRDLDKQFKRIV